MVDRATEQHDAQNPLQVSADVKVTLTVCDNAAKC